MAKPERVYIYMTLRLPRRKSSVFGICHERVRERARHWHNELITLIAFGALNKREDRRR